MYSCIHHFQFRNSVGSLFVRIGKTLYEMEKKYGEMCEFRRRLFDVFFLFVQSLNRIFFNIVPIISAWSERSDTLLNHAALCGISFINNVLFLVKVCWHRSNFHCCMCVCRKLLFFLHNFCLWQNVKCDRKELSIMQTANCEHN